MAVVLEAGKLHQMNSRRVSRTLCRTRRPQRLTSPRWRTKAEDLVGFGGKRGALAAAQQGFNPGKQLLKIKGFGEVVIRRLSLETRDFVRGFRPWP